jgi:cytochrome P450
LVPILTIPQAVIFEGLRIHPPFVGLPLKEVPAEGDIIDGKFVPGGVRIAPSSWAITRKKSIFGQDAELFRPERWLEADQAKSAEMRRTVELVFGYGRWACAGKPIAFLELNKIFFEVSALLRPFISPSPWLRRHPLKL